MRILRNLLTILFAITLVIFGINQYRSYKDKDVDPPVITGNENILHLSVKATDEDMLKGITAHDDRDGDVTFSLIISGKSNFIEDGVIRVDYAAFDSHNNVGTYSRRVVYDDYHSPRFSSEKPLILHSESSYDFSIFHAEDVLNGDISHKIKILSDSFAATSSSEYPIEIEVTNDYGDVEKLDLIMDIMTTREYNRQYPALKDYIVYIPVGKEVDFRDYLIGIREGDSILSFEETDFTSDDVEIDDYIDFNIPGKYTITFSLWQSYALTTSTKMLAIVTEDF